MSHPTPRWQRRAEDRPQEILEAALEVFVTRGYAATRLEDVAKQAGVSKGTVYLYYSGKEELFKALVEHAIVPELEAAEALVRGHEGSCRALLEKLLRYWWNNIACSRLSGIPKLMVSEAGNFPDLARYFADTVVRRNRALLQGVLETGMAAGEFRTLPGDLGARMVLSPLLFGVLWKHSFQPLETPPLDMDAYFETALEVLLRGLQEDESCES